MVRWMSFPGAGSDVTGNWGQFTGHVLEKHGIVTACRVVGIPGPGLLLLLLLLLLIGG
ncbi:hypothetical protein MY3296_005172 [Beauveria thailandica]